MKQLVGVWVAVLHGMPTIGIASPSSFRRTSLLEIEQSSIAVQSHSKVYPMPVVSHDKVAGGGYTQDSPLFHKQQAWTAVNGDNSLKEASADDMFKDIPEPYRPIWRMYYEQPFLMITGTFVHILLYILFAFIYREYKRTWSFIQPAEELKTAEADGQCWGWHRIFSDADKNSDVRILLCSFCCPIIRWADTIDNVKMMPGKFWHAFFLMLILGTIGPFTFGASILISLCVGIYFRHVRLRQEYLSLTPLAASGRVLSLLEDVFCWCCCTPCAIAQEAHQIEKIKRTRPLRS